MKRVNPPLDELPRAEDGAVGIPLANGKGIAWVDEADVPLVMFRGWYRLDMASGHSVRSYAYASRIGGMHRVILRLSKGDGLEADHRDHDGLNNRRNNLRVASVRENRRNQNPRANPDKESRYKGVRRRRKAWRAAINLPSKRLLQLGSFASEIEAALRYNVAAKKYFGEFARLNVVDES